MSRHPTRPWLPLALCAVLPGAALAHNSISADCDVDSDYDLRVDGDLIELHRENGSPQRVRLQGGTLWIDGQTQELSRADQQRLRQIETEVQALVPEIKAIAFEGVGIAAEAIGRVAALLGGQEGDRVATRLRAMQDDFERQFDQHLAQGDWNDKVFEREIEALVEELAPAVAGEIAALAVKAALSGDEAATRELEQRAKQLEQSLERDMDARGKALEKRANALCPRLREINELEDALELRLADGSRLDLLRM